LTGILAKWHVHPPVPDSCLSRFPDLPPLLVQCLFNRGLTTDRDVRRFLSAECDETDPFQIMGIADAVTRIRQAIRAGELIAVYGDFDADGVTATALVTETLYSVGANVIPYIPHRVDEGYGLNSAAIERLARRGASLIITVDCGARAVPQVELARGLGVDVIVTDHHSPGHRLPSALAVVDPKREDCSYAFKGLSGVGIAFKLAQALLLVGHELPLRRERDRLEEEQLLDLVALGTIADLSPLIGENRCLVQKGLAQLALARRPGLKALMDEAHVAPANVNAGTVGYVLGPRLNAAGRMDHAMLAYRLLTVSSTSKANELASLLEQKNRIRRDVTTATLEAARLQVADQEDQPLLFAVGSDFHEGVLGLAAQRLCEEYYRPAIVIRSDGDESVSSARSVSEFDITAALDECAPLLLRHGGHSKAAGFTTRTENLPELRRRLSEIAGERLEGTELRPTLDIDAEIPLGTLTPEHFSVCQQLEPLGQENPEPLLLSRGVEVRDTRVVGDNHLKMRLTGGHFVWDSIAFRMSEHAGELSSRIDVVYTPQVRTWRDRETLQLRVEDFRPTQ
jgi:single-stranded-DNA-specific exonuclease